MDPERIGPYQLERKLGSGGMGTVYLAHHDDTGETVAVKVLAASLAREEGFVRRFTQEIESLRRLINPHVVRLLDSDTDGDLCYFAMEYVNGETLSQKLRREKRLDWQEAVEMAIQICAALKSAHDAGIIHRDLKPSNLLIAADGMVKLTDFGVARVFGSADLTRTGSVIGTAEYMSPEQAQGKRVGKQSDLYSLGAVLYAMLTGRPPHVGRSTLEVLQKHKFGQFDRPIRYRDDIPTRLDDLVCQLLEKSVADRPPDAFVCSRMLQDLLDRERPARHSDTMLAGDVGTTDGAPTQTVDIAGQAGASTGSGKVGGTLMRDLLRSQLEEQQQRSPIQQWLDQTWVLVLLLGLLIVGGYLWFNRAPTTVEESFSGRKAESRVALRATTAIEKWLREKEPSPQDRYLREIQADLAAKNLPAAQEKLTAFASLAAQIRPDDADLQKLLAEVRDILTDDDLPSFVREPDREFLHQAVASAVAAGESEQARQLWENILVLHRDDPAAQSACAQALEWLRQHSGGDRPSTTPPNENGAPPGDTTPAQPARAE